MQKYEDWLDDDPDFGQVEYHKERQDVQRKRKGLADLHRQFRRKGAADMRSKAREQRRPTNLEKSLFFFQRAHIMNIVYDSRE